jgi:uncharacterized protein (TIGR00288 family)
MPDVRPHIALLIDADNAPSSALDAILDDLASYGGTNVRRAYGNWDQPNLKQWKELLHERAIRPVQQYDLSKGKNASDMALVVDAMTLLYTDPPDAFAIVSSDADFTPLVMHLRERGVAVYGFGDTKTPKPFVSACTRFVRTDRLVAAVEPEEPTASAQVKHSTTNKLKGDAGLVKLLRNAVTAAADESGWATVCAVGQHIRNQSSFDQRNYGYASLSKLLSATDLFEMRAEGKPGVSVRDRRVAKK